MSAFDSFAKTCEANGLKARDCGNGHWRVEGGVQPVNFYPFSKKRSIYINQTVNRIGFAGSVELAIQAAKGNLGREKEKRQSKVKLKYELLKKHPYCFGCETELTAKTATLDHIIPISKGGTNADGNLQLACESCNRKKADSLPTQQEQP